MEKIINVGFIGNPNCGKTTLFNAYTGANLKVATGPVSQWKRKKASRPMKIRSSVSLTFRESTV